MRNVRNINIPRVSAVAAAAGGGEAAADADLEERLNNLRRE